MGDSLLLDLAGWLDELSFEYAIVGGVAVVRYGVVRETKDVDVLVAPASAGRLGDRLVREGFAPSATDGENFQVYRRGPRDRIDLLFANNVFLRRVLQERRAVQVGGQRLQFAAIQHVVAMKLKANAADPERRAQDLADVVRLLDASSGEDRRMIEVVIRLYGRDDLL